MYFPYFYARRSELLTCRAILEDRGPIDSWAPVLEPVNTNVTDLVRCATLFGKAGATALILVNPTLHQLSDKTAANAFRKAINGLFDDFPTLIPAYKVRSDITVGNCNAFLNLYKGESLALLYSSPGLPNQEMKALGAEARVHYHLILNDKITGSQLAQLPKGKLVFVRDNFNKLARNADYGGPELFSDKHKTFKANGLGFGDYAVVGSVFQDSGSQPAAVAIHATFKHPDTGDIWVDHFVSDGKDRGVGDVASKFLEAARKLTAAAKKRPAEFGNDIALQAYAALVKASNFPGLGKNKEHQLVHHVSLTIEVITEAL